MGGVHLADFDFIRNADLRSCLDSDYGELQTVLGVGANKAALVLAGSIVEAVLCDYLLAYGPRGKGHKDPQKMQLGEMIDACHDLDVLSDKNRDLCSAVRHYRNLIHAGRLTRLNETADENSARVAASLVEIVSEAVSGAFGAERGLTCEQIVKKIETDPSSIPIMSHLLGPCRGEELARLVLDVLPARYREAVVASESPDGLSEITRAYRACYETAFRKAPVKVKKAAAAQVVAIVRQEPMGIVLHFEDAFLMAESLKHLGVHDRDTLKAHLMERLKTERSEFIIRASNGIGPHLDRSDALGFSYALISATAGEKDALACQRLLVAEFGEMTPLGKRATLWQIERLMDFYREHSQWDRHNRVKPLRRQLDPTWVDPDAQDDDDIPF
jgi:hypothetical protein